MFKRPKSGPGKHGGFRKRSRENGGEADAAAIVRPAREMKRGAVFSTKAEEGESDDEEEHAGTAVFASNRSVERREYRGGAFEASEIDASTDRDARAILERKVKLAAEGRTNDETKLYAGAAAYKSYVKVDESRIGGNKYTGTKGPIRAPQFVRNTCRFDYQPDVCKDYKDTGFCGYGDSCKFMHDRGNFKTGWQLEAEYKRQKERDKEREMLGKLGDNSDEERERDKFRVAPDDDNLPFACHLCRGPFRDPMQTLCHHFFCASCAQTHFRTAGSRCPVCNKQTSGVLNAATKLRAKAKALGGFDQLFNASARPDEPPPAAETYKNETLSVKEQKLPTIRPS
mmetsp:Transcript_8365/g.25985  ORF Transcript_8365/g.25985 Transcript_8365/m.25985 type:complete len:342 (+) Transcript_8365:71-1096(+)